MPLSPPTPPGTTNEPFDDAREKFERLTLQTPRDPEAKRAFIRKRIEMVRALPGVSDDERAAAIADLERLLE